MADENTIPDVTGTIDEVTTTTIVTKAGKSLPKFEIKIAGQGYSGIGPKPPVAAGDTVTLKLKKNGNFINLADILKGGVSVLPKQQFNRGGGMSTKALMVLAACVVATHNNPGKQISPKDLQAILPDLEKMAAE